MPINNPSDASPLIAIHTAVPGAHHPEETLLTVAHFQVNPATGTFNVDVDNINDNNTASIAQTSGVNEYAEVEFDLPVVIRQFRHFGDITMTGDGRWKLQYYDGEWHDWETGIEIRITANWSDWTFPVAGAKLCSKIRLVTTTVDTAIGASEIGELEIKY